jgi:hypothetical protein
MKIYSIEFNDYIFPSSLDNFTIYKQILHVNNNQYRLKSITKTPKSFIFTTQDINKEQKNIKTLILDGIKIKFSI